MGSMRWPGLACLMLSCSEVTAREPQPGREVLDASRAPDELRDASRSPEDELPADTYRLDVSHFSRPPYNETPGALPLRNESLGFPFDLDLRTRVITSEGLDRLAIIYNRLPCQGGTLSTEENDQLAESGFTKADITAKDVVRFESLAIEMPDPSMGGLPGPNEICFAYRTHDGKWHGHLEPLGTTHDAAAKVTRAMISVHADDVDLMGVVVFDGDVTSITYVARREFP